MNIKVKKVLYPLSIWFILLILAIINAGVRNSVYQPALGEYIGHAISSIVLSVLVFLTAYIFLKKTRIEFTRAELFGVGLFWLSLTIVFEFIFGHYVMGNPWDVLLADYNIFKGRLFVLVLLSILAAPSIVSPKRHKQ